ncbi:MAG: rane protein DedA family [Francisellaceae bacterium]|nr:rane protein DedA family [Francisellaceae bacterium]
MLFFQGLYDKVISWSKHRKAPYYLAAVSFLDASVFPISPVFMLVPMCIAKPRKALHYAGIATIASGLGGLFGYALGYLFEPYIHNFIIKFGYEARYQSALIWLHKNGFWTILTAGFTPVPYKIFTISAGAIKYHIHYFFLASIIGRGLRFLSISWLMKWGGEKMQRAIRKYVDKLVYGIIGSGLAFMLFKLV